MIARVRLDKGWSTSKPLVSLRWYPNEGTDVTRMGVRRQIFPVEAPTCLLVPQRSPRSKNHVTIERTHVLVPYCLRPPCCSHGSPPQAPRHFRPSNARPMRWTARAQAECHQCPNHRPLNLGRMCLVHRLQHACSTPMHQPHSDSD